MHCREILQTHFIQGKKRQKVFSFITGNSKQAVAGAREEVLCLAQTFETKSIFLHHVVLKTNYEIETIQSWDIQQITAIDTRPKDYSLVLYFEFQPRCEWHATALLLRNEFIWCLCAMKYNTTVRCFNVKL